MHVAAISSVTSSYASHPVARVQTVVAPAQASATNATSAASAAQKAAAAQTVNFGPAVQVQLSQQAQALLGQTTAANTNATAPSQAYLNFTYQTTAEQVWVQVLGSLGLTQAQLDNLPDSQRAADEAKATSLAEVRMSQEVAAPQGVSQSAEASAIDAAVAAISAA